MDARLIFGNALSIDLALSSGDLLTSKDLESAVILSLFTDRLASADEVEGAQDRRGWWGDDFGDVPEDSTGSKLWLLDREKQTQQTLNRAVSYANEALAWLVEDGIALNVTVTGEWVRMGVLGLGIEIVRPSGVENYRYDYLWEDLKNG